MKRMVDKGLVFAIIVLVGLLIEFLCYAWWLVFVVVGIVVIYVLVRMINYLVKKNREKKNGRVKEKNDIQIEKTSCSSLPKGGNR